ncbi:MAG: hypothetical protein A3B99_01845 [Candidatus Yanofskybacteria bacterium RIFCSPHIGHO2_02_FULL_44_12b]|uniref:Phosphatidic acid phosphatase type 2/haloperoxidase domain-containing protein n=2 Tax=Candidatus Yanofskyibacteriota TaxID=1752733 RepID=A0A1F8GLY7_9BACT|nr:MAG: Bacitracin transport permease protein BCRC [Candidatus Yanofskybacteria bacterium GW2011_GWA2_44_9]OGN05285.1 MAG: hypothetical protein A2659_05025 [Candidatus Yanofskybacteria bacterium RIFCSPHIGHO2_01_FULL_44_24]OGN14984.1 MAG: hypothetical protein A3B99_01845 [Candidatus Yanofskybacteria bacterium RIFCSPHIGHO2_02_FULL_44_12b]OGN26422.1 MAG: hypothetical protein A2925_03555 [Candidatus Yanofskybacteria bacterium RIFCSPLOWO2_01_FULL_44_22]
MNEILFREINSWTSQIYWLDRFMVFSAEWLGYFLILLLIAPLLLTFFIRNKYISLLVRSALLKLSYYKEMVVVAFGSAIIARLIFAEAIRFFYYNPRPFLVLDNVKQLINHETTGSLPSGHASFYFALAAGVYIYNKKAGRIYLISAGLIGFARVFSGVHWPADILAGAALGIGTAFLVRHLYRKYKTGR